MSEVSVFCDESGGENGHSRYCLITLVFHICARLEREEVAVMPSTRVAKALRDNALELAAALRSLGPGDCAASILADAALVAERIERLYGAAPDNRDAAIIGMERCAMAHAEEFFEEAQNV